MSKTYNAIVAGMPISDGGIRDWTLFQRILEPMVLSLRWRGYLIMVTLRIESLMTTPRKVINFKQVNAKHVLTADTCLSYWCLK